MCMEGSIISYLSLVFSAGHSNVTMGVFKTHLILLAVIFSIIPGKIIGHALVIPFLYR